MFSRIAVPTPFQMGPVNAYLADRTLVDPGPDSEAAWRALRAGLDDRDLAPGDVERLLITHPHPDHFGLAHRFADAGATVVASPDAAAIVSDFDTRLEYEQTYFADLFERCGMGRETAESVTRLPEAFLPYVEDVAVEQECTPGTTLSVGDGTVRVDALAGHAVGELRFTYEESTARVSIVGDHVLPDHTPNPFLQPPTDHGGERPRVLPAFDDSLDALRKEPLDRLLPGHGDPIADPVERIDAIRAHHEDRTARVAELVDGPTTPVAVMEGLFGDLPATEQFAGMSEALGHLDVLEVRGQVTSVERDGTLVYERTGDANADGTAKN